MRVVIVGAGGREHALAHRVAAEGHEVFGLPGNPGLARLGRCLDDVRADDVPRASDAIESIHPDLVVIGPEAPLAAGLADALRARGIVTFGPSASAARLEASKAFSKRLMADAGIPTARFLVATDAASLDHALDVLGGAVAVKADGLAAGKGVVVCSTVDEAREAGRRLLALGSLVVEERLEGPELSVIALTDGRGLAILPPARDHKRLRDGDEGPNTGGMGAVCPVPIPGELLASITDDVFRPTLRAMERAGAPFQGALYAGLMLTPNGPRVLEFNARFGDPEAQALVAAIDSNVSLTQLLLDASTGSLEDQRVPAGLAACCVVLAAPGYPDHPESGDEITGLDAAEATGARVFHAGTKQVDGQLVTAGGRVLGVVGTGVSMAEARLQANQGAALVHFRGVQRRSDIGLSVG